jgi:hypothetical protein
MKPLLFLPCAALLAALAVPAAALNRPAVFERTLSENQELRVQLTGGVSYFSFIPSRDGACRVEVVDPGGTAVYLVLLDERLERTASGRGPNEGVSFDARRGSACHVAIMPIDGRRSRGATVTVRLAFTGAADSPGSGK